MKYVIIGNGVAGTTAAEHIRKLDSESEVTIISNENYPFYSRIRLIEHLAGTATPDDIIIKKPDWYSENKLELILKDPVININKVSKVVDTQNGRSYQSHQRGPVELTIRHSRLKNEHRYSYQVFFLLKTSVFEFRANLLNLPSAGNPKLLRDCCISDRLTILPVLLAGCT